MDRHTESGEHILVCISPSPSNPKVISAAARMADAFQAALTAIYVRPTNYEALSEEDRARLQNNIRFAERSGASVTTIIGDDVPAQVAEYAHISGTTKIVVGRSGIRRRHFWSKPPLTEQIILNAPDVDVYIIPDSAADLKQRKESSPVSESMRPTLKEAVYTLLLLLAATLLGLVFTRFGFSEANIITVFILGVLVISVVTINPLFSVVGSLAGVLLFNWFFIDPKFSFHTYEAEYAVTFAIMLTSSLITGTLANRLKQNARQSAREAFRTKVLLDTNQLLQKAERPAEVLQTTARQIITLLNRDIVIYPRDAGGPLAEGTVFRADGSDADAGTPDENEKEIAGWVFSHQRSAGFRMEQYETARSQYHAICLNGYCCGVIAIRLDRVPLEPFENSIVTSILGECALALENLRNAEEKERADLMVRNEQLRSNLLRSVSHDIRTPLTSISGNASNLLTHYRQLDDETKEQIFSDIYDDAEWLIDLVENLLSISRIENGQMELHLSSEVMGDVIEEAIRHADRNAARHTLTVRHADEILLVDMDARLIMQVLINLINNAVKNTPEGSRITIESRRESAEAVVTVRDDGPGIPDEIKPHVFEMFYTGQNKVADGRRGMGLGLALCKSIVEAHHGAITLTDNEPSGCCFTVSLPMKEVQVHE
ncbi:MAG: sensor histidine kinase KdpD [Oscillospiraceae bacterium]|nr:sensor histidine kinase KdpD [Oscillospiraceae bacterium]